MVAVTDEESLGTGCETGGISLTFVVTGCPVPQPRDWRPPSVQLLRGRGPVPALPQGVQGRGIETLLGVHGTLRDVCFVFRKWSNFLFPTRAHEVSCGFVNTLLPPLTQERPRAESESGGCVKMNCPARLLPAPSSSGLASCQVLEPCGRRVVWCRPLPGSQWQRVPSGVLARGPQSAAVGTD